jgi:hypothetical protein
VAVVARSVEARADEEAAVDVPEDVATDPALESSEEGTDATIEVTEPEPDDESDG